MAGSVSAAPVEAQTKEHLPTETLCLNLQQKTLQITYPATCSLATQVYDATPRMAHGLLLIPQPVILAPVAKARMKEALVI